LTRGATREYSHLKKKGFKHCLNCWGGISEMKAQFYTLILVIGSLMCAGSTLSGLLSPSIQLSETDYHFKEAGEGSILSHNYMVKNTGSAVLEIIDVRPG
jgi:hypothetical protein